MDNIEQQLKAFENDTNAEQNIRNAITKAYGGLKPELETINTFENQQFPSFYDSFQGNGMDMGAAGLDPATRLANAWREAGRATTSANVARGAFDVRRAGMEDLISTAMNDYNARYGRLSDAWNRALQRAQLARMGGGGSTTENPKYIWDKNNNGVVDDNELALFESLMGDTGTTPPGTPAAAGTPKLPAAQQTGQTPWWQNAGRGVVAGTLLGGPVGAVTGGLIGGFASPYINIAQKLGLKNTWNLLRNGVPQRPNLVPNFNPQA